MAVLVAAARPRLVHPTKSFPLARKNDPERISPAKMGRRMWIFGAAWVAVFVLLPLPWALGLACAWLLIMIPGLIEIHRQFQHLPAAEP